MNEWLAGGGVPQAVRFFLIFLLWCIGTLGGCVIGMLLGLLTGRVVAKRLLGHADPASAQKQRDLGVSHIKLFDIEKKLANRSAARAQLAAFVAVWGKLEAEGRLLTPKDRTALKRRRQQLDEWVD